MIGKALKATLFPVLLRSKLDKVPGVVKAISLNQPYQVNSWVSNLNVHSFLKTICLLFLAVDFYFKVISKVLKIGTMGKLSHFQGNSGGTFQSICFDKTQRKWFQNVMFLSQYFQSLWKVKMFFIQNVDIFLAVFTSNAV